MAKTVQFVAAPEELPLLGSLVPEAKSPISPFLIPPTAKPVTAVPNLAAKLGLGDKKGALTEDAKRTLRVLACATSYARTFLKDPSQLFEQVIYHAPDGGPDVSLTTTNQGLKIEDPAPVEEVLQSLRQYFGETVLRSFDFQAEVKREDALVLMALADSHRRRVFSAFANWGEVDQTPYKQEQVLLAIQSVPLNSQWLVFAIRGMYKDQLQVTAQGVGASLDRLAKSGLIARADGWFLLSEKLAWMAGRMLIMDKVLHIEAGKVTSSGGVMYAGFSCFQAGVQDLLYVEKGERTVTFDSPSSSAVLEMARHFLTDPEALKEETDQTVILDSAPQIGEAASKLVPLKLVVISEALSGGEFRLSKDSQAGRAPDNEMILEDPHVSRHHARFLLDGDGAWSVEDLGSANGTLVNDALIAKPVRLKPGDTVKLSSVVLKVV